MAEYYALNEDKTVTPIADTLEWARAYEDRERRRVGMTEFEDGTWISTVFLGLNHQYGDGPPLIFETMVFPSKENLDERAMWRYSTYEEAEAGHARAVELVKERLDAGLPIEGIDDE